MASAGLNTSAASLEEEAVREASWDAVEAFLREIEHTEPRDFPSIDAMRRFLVDVGRTRRYRNPRVVLSPEAQAISLPTWSDERHRLASYVMGLSEADLEQIEPVPYRCFLSTDRANEIWDKVGQRWGVRRGRYWFPLRPEEPSADLLILWASEIRETPALHELLGLLYDHGVSRVYELHELAALPQYELDPAIWDWSFPETYWTSEASDWLIYLSPENSVSLGGDWLISGVKRAWPDWKRMVWQRRF